MAIEQNFFNLRGEMAKVTGAKSNTSYLMEYSEAYEIVFNDEDFKNKMNADIEHKMNDKSNAK